MCCIKKLTTNSFDQCFIFAPRMLLTEFDALVNQSC